MEGTESGRGWGRGGFHGTIGIVMLQAAKYERLKDGYKVKGDGMDTEEFKTRFALLTREYILFITLGTQGKNVGFRAWMSSRSSLGSP